MSVFFHANGSQDKGAYLEIVKVYVIYHKGECHCKPTFDYNYWRIPAVRVVQSI